MTRVLPLSQRSLRRQALPLTADADQLQTLLGTLSPESCPRTYNFHMHTLHSDGQLPPQGIMEQAVAIGLKGMAITDHHSIKGYWDAKSWLENRRWHGIAGETLPQLWVGVEINAELLGIEVHILGYGFNPDHLAMRPYLQGRSPRGIAYLAKNIIQAIQAAGGLAILAHPARYRRSANELIPCAAEHGIDGVETYYAYGNPDPWQPSLPQCEEVYRLAQHYGLLSSCGTDTHGQSLLRRI